MLSYSYLTPLYILGIPETSLRGRSTLTARRVRKSKLLPLPVFANNVINLERRDNAKGRCEELIIIEKQNMELTKKPFEVIHKTPTSLHENQPDLL